MSDNLWEHKGHLKTLIPDVLVISQYDCDIQSVSSVLVLLRTEYPYSETPDQDYSRILETGHSDPSDVEIWFASMANMVKTHILK